jgi:N-acyl-D-aspartate/D-glutamate deacylase
VARLLGHYVRERGVLSLEAAIERITSRPADRLRLNGRGRLAIGAFADIAVFDPATVADQASVRAPTEHPTGFHTTIVNGAVAFAAGARTGARTGRVLRRNWT